MAAPLHVARASIERLDALHRRATIALGFTTDFGVRGAIQEFFHLAPARELPLPVDYVVAATGG